MKNYKIVLQNNLDEYASHEITDFNRSLEESCKGEIIENADLALFCIMMNSLVENFDIKEVDLTKSEDQEEYIWTIYYNEDGGIYYTRVTAERAYEDNLNTSFIDKIQENLRDYGIREVLGISYKDKPNFEDHE